MTSLLNGECDEFVYSMMHHTVAANHAQDVSWNVIQRYEVEVWYI